MQHRIHRSWGIFCCIVNECARILCGLAFKCRLAVGRLRLSLSLSLSLSLPRDPRDRERGRERKRDPCAARNRTREGRFPSVASPLVCVSLGRIFFRSAGSLALDCKRSEFGDVGMEGRGEGGKKKKDAHHPRDAWRRFVVVDTYMP